MEIKHTKRLIEIRSVLMGAMAENKNFLIWQRDLNNEILFQVKANLESINEEGFMNFILHNDIQLDTNAETFFAIVDSTIVFKTNGAQIEGRHFTFPLPEEAKYKERRRHLRTKYKLKDYKQVELKFSKNEDFSEEKILSNVLDISESGICFLVTKETLSILNSIEEFFINAISSDLGFDVEKGRIMNARKYKGATLSKGEFYALGVMFL